MKTIAAIIALAFVLGACSQNAERFDKEPRSWTKTYEPQAAPPPAPPPPRAKPKKKKKKVTVYYRPSLMRCRSQACAELCSAPDVGSRPKWCKSFSPQGRK
jgi:hypothetical protein